MEAPGAEVPQAPRSSTKGASRIERRRREDQGLWEGVSASLPWEESGDGALVSIFELKKASFGAF